MTDETPHDGPYAWFRLGVTLAIGIIGNVGMWAIVLILPAIEQDFGVDRTLASLPYALTMLGFAAGSLVLGRVADRRGIVASLVGAALVLGVAYGVAAMAPSLAVFALAQVAIGLGTGVAFGPLLADVSHWFIRRRGIAVAIAACGNYLSGAVWPFVLSPVLAGYGWRAVCTLLAVASVAGLIPLALLLRRRIPQAAAAHAAAARPLLPIALSPRALVGLLSLAGIGCCVAMSMPQVHIVALSVDLGFGAEAGATMLSLMLTGGVVSRLVFGALSDRLGGLRTLLCASSMQCLALFLFIPFDTRGALMAVSLLFGLSQGGIVPSYAVIVREYLPPRDAGALVGLVIGATIIGMGLGGWMSGWIFDLTGSYTMAVINGVGWNLLNLGVVLLVLSRTRPAVGVPA